jgi:ATP/maltotriose-dependent transcriptional regulator MalT
MAGSVGPGQNEAMPADDAFVGRGRELAILAEELGRVRAGVPRLVWLSGEAGIGKTTLLRRFLAGVFDARVLWASGDEDEIDLPYGVLNQLVADLPAGAMKGWTSNGSGVSSGTDPLAVGSALLSALGSSRMSGPIVIVVDDAHWADERSAQALVFVLRRLRNDHVLALLSARPEASTAAMASWERALAQSQLSRRLPLGGLTADDLRQLAPTLDAIGLSPAASRRLYEHTGGHPLHVRALLAELPADALLEPTGVLPAPHSLSSLVLVRLAKLSEAAQTLVLAVAVLGSRCILTDAVAVADLADPVNALDEAVRAGLLVEGLPGHRRDVAFSHPLYRGAVYADLAPARRHALHLRAAAVLGGTAALTHRVAAAVGPDAALASELVTLAAGELQARSWRPATDHLLAAADLSTTAADRGQRLTGAVAAMLAGGDIARAVRYEPVVRSAPQSADRSLVLGQIAVFTGQFSTARGELTAALEEASDSGETGQQAVVSAYLGLACFVEGQTDRAVELATEAFDGNLDTDVAPIAGFVLVSGLATLGRQAEALALLDFFSARDASRPASAVQADTLRGLLALWSYSDEQAAAILGDVVRKMPPGIMLSGQIEALISLAEALYRLGDWDGAATHADLALSLAQDAGIVLGEGTTHAVASYLAAGRGSWDAAEALVEVAVRAAENLPWWASRAYAASARATLAQARGEYAAMRDALAPMNEPELVALLDGLGSLGWRALLVEALLGLGLTDEAAAALRELEEGGADGRSGWSTLEAARLRAWLTELVDDADSTRTAYEHAMVLAENLSVPLSRARLETAYGRFLLEQGERRPALDMLRAAHERLERLQAKPYLAVCDELLHDAGLRPSTVGDPLDLTVHELAVARLVAAGRTNSEAGLELFITSRTVAYHLTNIYAKAGISSRRELAERFPQLQT